MALKEYENNIYTKTKDDKVSNYLKNIIQRYFEIEEDMSKDTREAVIVQAYTRLKEYINAFDNEFILTLNEKSGMIDLSFYDINAERRFDKNSAYNKDFCNDGENTSDAIVSGNDTRLTDSRIPLTHTHSIDDINGLRELLDNYNILNKNFHIHKNKDVLDMISYAGTKSSIDLLLLKDLSEKVEKAIERFEDTDEYFSNIAKHYLIQLHDITVISIDRIEEIRNSVNTWLSEWNNETMDYARSQADATVRALNKIHKNCYTIEDYNRLKNIIENAIIKVDDGEINGTDSLFALEKIESVDEKEDGAKAYTKVSTSLNINHQITDSNVLSNFKDNKINNGSIKVILKYVKNGITHRSVLPHMYCINNSKYDHVYAYYETDSDNNINIKFDRYSFMPIYVHNSVTFVAEAKDQSNRTRSTSISVNKDNLDTVSMNYTQEDDSIKSSDSCDKLIKNIKFTTSETKALNNVTCTNPTADGNYFRLMYFTVSSNYNGSIKITKANGHWYGFYIYEISSEDDAGEEVAHKFDIDSGTHEDDPLSFTANNVTLKTGKIYKILVGQCSSSSCSPDCYEKRLESTEMVNNKRVYHYTPLDTTKDKYTFVASGLTVNIGEFNNSTISQNIQITANTLSENANYINKAKIRITYQLASSAYNFRLLKKINDSDWYISNTNPNIINGDNVEFVDNIESNAPNRPRIDAKCLSYTDDDTTYEFTISYSDKVEDIKYKIQVLGKNNGIDYGIKESQELNISGHSGIKELKYSIRCNGMVIDDFTTNTDVCELVSDTDIDSHTKKVVIKVKNTVAPPDDRLLFYCHDEYTHQGAIDFLKTYNANLCTVTDSNKNYIDTIVSPKTGEGIVYKQCHIGNQSNSNNKVCYYYDGGIEENNDEECSFCGEFQYHRLNELFPEAQLLYKLFKVPGKGETTT